MNPMKTEINLRTREFVIAREFYWPRVAHLVSIILILAGLAAGMVYAQHLLETLAQNVAYLRVRTEELKQRVIPLQEMETEIEGMQARAAIRDQLLERITPFSRYLEEVEGTAVAAGMHLKSIEAKNTEKAVFHGYGRTMQEIALYIQALNEKPFVTGAEYTGMRLEGDGYSFVAEAFLVVGGGLD